MEIQIKADLLGNNEDQALINRTRYNQHGVFCINVMGSPGAGKTTLLERTIDMLKDKISIAVIEGDIYTAKDAERIEAHGIPVVQINTEGACHLDAPMVNKVLDRFELEKLDLMIVENVGNLVCPVEFNTGEHIKVAVLSIIEGDDKPLKYPLIFRESEAVVLNKVDLAPFCDADIEQMKQDLRSINPNINIFSVSCRTGEGLEAWSQWLLSETNKPR